MPHHTTLHPGLRDWLSYLEPSFFAPATVPMPPRHGRRCCACQARYTTTHLARRAWSPFSAIRCVVLWWRTEGQTVVGVGSRARPPLCGTRGIEKLECRLWLRRRGTRSASGVVADYLAFLARHPGRRRRGSHVRDHDTIIVAS